jgi:hypothetical protein
LTDLFDGQGQRELEEAGIMAKKPPSEVSVGKFDILASYVYAQSLLHGLDDDEAKQRGMVAAIMRAQTRLRVCKEHHEEFQAQKEASEQKKKTTITSWHNSPKRKWTCLTPRLSSALSIT